MVAPLSDIRKQLSKLTTHALALRAEFASAYQNYLLVLSESVQSQLVLVCFGLCTERHAQQFLALSLTQRQTLQQDLQKLGMELGTELMQQGEKYFSDGSESEQTPITIHQAIGNLETALSETLRKSSLAINRLLEHHNILKIKSLDALFEIVAKADTAGRSITNPPLLVKAIIDAKEDQDDETQVQPLTAVYLQISDLEFADAKLLSARQPIRQLMQQLNTLQKNYTSKQTEETMAEASEAWRACWYTYDARN